MKYYLKNYFLCKLEVTPVYVYLHHILLFQAVDLTILSVLLGVSSLVFEYSAVFWAYKPIFVFVSYSYAFFQHGLPNPEMCIRDRFNS